MKIGALQPALLGISDNSPVFAVLFVLCLIVRSVRYDVLELW